MRPLRIKSWFKNKLSKSDGEIENLVLKAQSGDERIRHNLLEQYKPFVKKVVSKACKRYISESMDEYSIGLLALNEAIDQFNQEQGGKFLSFASIVINRRIIDHIRKESRHNHILFSDEEDEEGNIQENYIERKTSLEKYVMEEERKKRVEEIKDYQQLLFSYGITFEVLSSECPKHIDARENAKIVAKTIADDVGLRGALVEKKRLPIKELEERVSCSRKTIERNRKYIIAIALIYIGEFNALKSYIAPE
ncbi:RNA polymerase sigma-I factor [Schinkia azotoformans MEV2011]|uniref:RNA polymerase sigma factor SigI n=2 Tax=Schinkia azotoformans TaxID=1454 RepID=K6E3L7_SCHAZ|nr:RNA polymerase sigma-I factor [Schinkia azotoformans]EKN67821.1 putative RNA polymerase sigma factor SigI [Schinkia azotoformans LMG 9581]KEF40178.1 RNA polymerase sigma-I factor [Schinkia azotoformans MEV2011]MEC1637414.1 RNA polymerase sigma-I factor [Schinkia azotoformans]MEC1694804.1 RNA polymerase sigma-I factor [Schinkia azotoformans]MEC1716834.1 RNA polymerase sigma-I factor [Schinkia azotoformans]